MESKINDVDSICKNNTNLIFDILNIKKDKHHIRKFNHDCIPLYKPYCAKLYEILNNKGITKQNWTEKYNVELYALYLEMVGYTSFVGLFTDTITNNDTEFNFNTPVLSISTSDDDSNIVKFLHSKFHKEHEKEQGLMDVVILYVDGNDPVWIERKTNFSRKNNTEVHRRGSTDQRFVTDDTLLYAVRSIDEYLDCVNNVYLVVECPSQVPQWIDTDVVKIIYHHDIIPKELLPVYNSTTIEIFLHRIPGLLNRYIYLNDDVIINKTLKFTDLFDGDRPKTNILGYNDNPKFRPSIDSLYYHIHKNNIDLISRETGISLDGPHFTEHGITCYNREDNEYLFEKYRNEIIDSCSTFRHPQNFNQYLFAIYSWVKNGMINDGTHAVFLLTNQSYKICKIIRDSHLDPLSDVISINTSSSSAGHDEDGLKCIIKSLDQKFPLRSKYEKRQTTAICVISKHEELYIDEWVKYYRDLGVDKILFYDNNPQGDDSQYNKVLPYIEQGILIYHDWRSVSDHSQFLSCIDCARRYFTKFNYIGFFDMDEFLYMKKNSLDSLLSKQILFNEPLIHINWVPYGDSGLLKYSETPIIKRFTDICNPFNYKRGFQESSYVKTIVNTLALRKKLPNHDKYYNGWLTESNKMIAGACHAPYSSILRAVDFSGNVVPNISSSQCDTSEIVLNHYRTKTADEYMDKLNRGNTANTTDQSRIAWYISMLRLFYEYNEVTPEKLDIMYKKMNPDIKRYIEENKISIV